MRTIVIDVDHQALEKLVSQLKKCSGIKIIGTYTSLSDDLKDVLNEEIDIIFIDYSLSDNARMDFIIQLVQQYPSIQIILMKSDAHHLEESTISEIQFLSKPINQTTLETTIENKRNKMMKRANLRNKITPIIEPNPLVKEKTESIFLKMIKD